MEPQIRVIRPPVKRPTVVVILAVLNLLVGGGGILIAPMILLSVLAAPSPNQQMPGTSPNLQGISFLWLIGSYCTSVLLVAAGVGLLRMKLWAWWTSLGCAAFALISFLLSRALLLVLSIGASSQRGSFFVMLVAGTAMLCLPMFVHPVLTLFVLLPRYVRQAFEHASAPRTESDIPPVAHIAPSANTYAESTLPSAIRWLTFGPSLPPYRPSRMKGRDAGCKWAMLLAPTTFAAMLIVTVGIFAKFVIADAPAVLMGTLALILGALTLAGALFEWQWFFENRAARGVRFWAGDQGTRWLYVGVSGVLLLLGFRLVGHTAMPSMAGKHPFLRMTNGNSTAESSTSTLGGFFGERSPLCGGTGGSPFERFDPDYRPMVGVRYELGNWGGQQVIAKIEPLFERSTPGERVVMAKDGYQISGLLVDSRDFVNAVRIIFIRAEGAQHETTETYQSDWIGTANQSTPQQLGGDGRTPVGVFGRQGVITDAIGLLFEPSDN